MEIKETTECPSCALESSDCNCGLTRIVTIYQNGIKSGDVEVATVQADDESEGKVGYKINAHCVIKHKDCVIEQYLNDNLLTTVGPFQGERGEATFKIVAASLKSRAVSVLSARTVVAEA